MRMQNDKAKFKKIDFKKRLHDIVLNTVASNVESQAK